jgi:mono/diheme cytochrome c family protein
MPFGTYNNMSDDDVKAIVAYLRTVKPVHNEVQPPKYKIPLQPMPPAKGTAAPPKTDKVAYGNYLVNAIAHCHECHTPFEGPQPDFANQYGAGGLVIIVNGVGLRTRNITPDKETGIGSWSDAEIKRAITQGIAKDGRKLIPLMPYPYFKNMTAEDLDAIVAYLHTIKPVKKKIEANPTLAELMKKKK